MLSNEKILNLTFISTSSHGYLKVDKQTFKDLNFNSLIILVKIIVYIILLIVYQYGYNKQQR